jgi:predicted  nucleic acid-binding Zn-ribbon protein
LYNRLKILYQLQKIDDQLDELEELRGDLPNMVRELEEKIKSFITDVESKEKEQKDSLKKRDENEDEIEKLKENQKKFKHSFTGKQQNAMSYQGNRSHRGQVSNKPRIIHLQTEAKYSSIRNKSNSI